MERLTNDYVFGSLLCWKYLDCRMVSEIRAWWLKNCLLMLMLWLLLISCSILITFWITTVVTVESVLAVEVPMSLPSWIYCFYYYFATAGRNRTSDGDVWQKQKIVQTMRLLLLQFQWDRMQRQKVATTRTTTATKVEKCSDTVIKMKIENRLGPNLRLEHFSRREIESCGCDFINLLQRFSQHYARSGGDDTRTA